MRYEGKYPRRSRFIAAKLKRGVMRALFRPLLKWQPLTDPIDGYSLIIGVATDLPEILNANLAFIAKQQHENLHEIICVLDRPRDASAERIIASARETYSDLPLRFITYTPMQSRVLDAIKWGWAYAWLSWSIGIAACRSRHAVLHDYDAMVIAPDFFERRYAELLEKNVEYFGIRFYRQNGLNREDRLVVTFELIFDAQHVRAHHKPLDLFSKVGRMGERAVDFDTFLYAQSQAGEKAVRGCGTDSLVHPSQLLCQFTAMGRDPSYVLPGGTSIPMVPYFLYAGGMEEPLRELTADFQQSEAGTPRLLGRTMDLRQVSADRVEWYEIQATQMERLLVGEMRPEVARYFAALRDHLSGD